MIAINVTEKGGEQRRLEFQKEEVTVGRVQGNDIVLPKGNVSKRHARVVSKDGKLVIVDLKSTNGTYVNGRKITTPLVVSTADKIYIGDFILIAEQGTAADAAEPVRNPSAPPPPPPNTGNPPGLGEPPPRSAGVIPSAGGNPPHMAPPANYPPPQPNVDGSFPTVAGMAPAVPPAAPQGGSPPASMQDLGVAPPPAAGANVPPSPLAPPMTSPERLPSNPTGSIPDLPPQMAPDARPMTGSQEVSLGPPGAPDLAEAPPAAPPPPAAAAPQAPQAPPPVAPQAPPPVAPQAPAPVAPQAPAPAAPQAPPPQMLTSRPSPMLNQPTAGQPPAPTATPDAAITALVGEMAQLIAADMGLAAIPLSLSTANALKDKAEQTARRLATQFRARLPSGKSVEDISTPAIREALALGSVTDLLLDPGVTRVCVDSHDAVWVGRGDSLERHSAGISTPSALSLMMARLGIQDGRGVARIGDFVATVVPAAAGPAVRFDRVAPMSLSDLVLAGNCSAEAAQFLERTIGAGANILVAGADPSWTLPWLSALSGVVESSSLVASIGICGFATHAARWITASANSRDVINELSPDVVVADITSMTPALVASWGSGVAGALVRVGAGTPEQALAQLDYALNATGSMQAVSDAFRLVLVVNQAGQIEKLSETKIEGDRFYATDLFANHQGEITEIGAPTITDYLTSLGK